MSNLSIGNSVKQLGSLIQEPLKQVKQVESQTSNTELKRFNPQQLTKSVSLPNLNDLESSIFDQIDQATPQKMMQNLQKMQTETGDINLLAKSNPSQTTQAKESSHVDNLISTLKKSGNSDLEKGGQILSQVSNGLTLVNQVSDWVNTDSDDPSIQDKRNQLLKGGLKVLGGESLVKLGEKLQDFTEEMDFESGKEVVLALKEFGNDEGLISKGLRTGFKEGVQKALPRTVARSLLSGIPILNYGMAGLDGLIAAGKIKDYIDGEVTGKEALKATVTAVGSIVGSTVAPVVGPLVAAGINVGIDTLEPLYEKVTSLTSWVSNGLGELFA